MGKIKNRDYTVESSMSQYMREALARVPRRTTKLILASRISSWNSANPVIIEDKFRLNRLVSQNKDGIKNDPASISNFAVKWRTVLCARNMIASGKYREVVAIGVAGDQCRQRRNQHLLRIWLWRSSYKHMNDYATLDF